MRSISSSSYHFDLGVYCVAFPIRALPPVLTEENINDVFPNTTPYLRSQSKIERDWAYSVFSPIFPIPPKKHLVTIMDA